jgi:hypothetical protein
MPKRQILASRRSGLPAGIITSWRYALSAMTGRPTDHRSRKTARREKDRFCRRHARSPTASGDSVWIGRGRACVTPSGVDSSVAVRDLSQRAKISGDCSLILRINMSAMVEIDKQVI